MLSFTRTVLFVLSLSVLLSQPALVAAQNIALPEIGDSSGALVTPTEEIRTGEAVVRNIRRMGGILDDPLTNDYLNNLGFKLVSHSDTKQRHFEFFMVNDGGINAFALPGGYIGINYGLFLATESENELASVIAHETAHVTQRHHARAYERAKKPEHTGDGGTAGSDYSGLTRKPNRLGGNGGNIGGFCPGTNQLHP